MSVEKKLKKRKSEEAGVNTGDVNQKERKRSRTNENSDAGLERKKKKRKDKEKRGVADEASKPDPAVGQKAPPVKEKKKKQKGSQLPLPDSSKAYISEQNITLHSPEAEQLSPIQDFALLEIPDVLRPALAAFKSPTPIQACTWPPLLQGHDVIGIAETGSGKTMAFGLPAISRLLQDDTLSGISVLVLAPTRELAIQTHETLQALVESSNIQSVCLYGGVEKTEQRKLLSQTGKGKNQGRPVTRIVVGTPGRILDLMEEGCLDLSSVRYLVLDEADRMLDKGFENDIQRIAQKVPRTERQTVMFSATWPESVRRLASTFLKNPYRVTVGSADLTANSRIIQSVHVLNDSRSKDPQLLKQLNELSAPKKGKHATDSSRILVFALYKKEAARVQSNLQRAGYAVSGLHGDMSQSARIAALASFKSGETPLMVATDVAARGLDIPNVRAVFNYTFPLTVEDYVHRIGRTGRGGASGISITFFTGEAHERSLAGEFARVLQDGGGDAEELRKNFPMTIKKKVHGSYGAFFKDDPTLAAAEPTRIVFD